MRLPSPKENEPESCNQVLSAVVKKKATNPFYVVLLIVGILFVITASAYSVLAVKGSDPAPAGQTTASDQTFLELVDQHGFTALMVELCVLAAATFAAIATDEYWRRRSLGEAEQRGKAPAKTGAETDD